MDKDNKTLLELKSRSVTELRKLHVTDQGKAKSISLRRTVEGQVSSEYLQTSLKDVLLVEKFVTSLSSVAS